MDSLTGFEIRRNCEGVLTILLIRHGETASNAARVLQIPDTPLNERGIAQAGRLSRRLVSEEVTNILSSDLKRALMTAQCLQAATGATLRLDPRLQERNYGDVRGRAYAELGVSILDPDYEPPGGERWSVFHARVDGVWHEIVRASARAPGNLAVVTHGLVCHRFALRHLQLPPEVEPPLHWGNTSLTIIESHSPWRVRLLNCTAHLDSQTADKIEAPSSG